MLDGKRNHDGGIAGCVMSLIANANRDPKKQSRPFTPNEFNPFRKPEPKQVVSVRELGIMLGAKPKKEPSG